MPADPIPEDEDPEIDNGTLSDVIRKPTRTAGDLSEVADSSSWMTTEDVDRNLESVASKSRTSTEREQLEELRRRVDRIEKRLGIGGTEPVDEELERSEKLNPNAELVIDDPTD